MNGPATGDGGSGRGPLGLPRSLLCIYACDADRAFLSALKKTRCYRRAVDSDHVRVLEVFADPTLERPILEGDRLTLNCEEAYDALSIKTHAMIRYCVAELPFDHLLKLDCTLVDYSRRPSNRSIEMLRQVFTIDNVERLMFDPAGYSGDYRGLHWQTASREGVANWARVKGLAEPDMNRIFGDRRELSYYAGKFYILSHRFCAYVASHGEKIAKEHRRFLNGSEDLMVGRLFERFSQHDLA